MFLQPISKAFSFISFANSSIEPDICSAKMYPASFAECTKNTVNKSFTLISSPSERYAEEYPDGIVEIAELDTVTISSKLHFSKAIIAVNILVVLAGYIFSSEFFE